MNAEEFLRILSRAEKLKNTIRHCYTSSGRQESVAEHSWRLALMAMLLSAEEEFRQADMNKVVRMCLIHDLGEAFTGDIPAFEKSAEHDRREQTLLNEWVAGFPAAPREEFQALLAEMNAQQTLEARLYKALDKIEAVIQHNESDIATWLPLEYELQYEHGKQQLQFSPWLRELKAAVDAWTTEKIQNEKP